MWREFSRVVLAGVCLWVLASAHPSAVQAEARRDRFGAGGYFRIMTRPDFQGGNSRLGLWNLHGRLLNEGPWGTLELRLDLLQPTVGTDDVWTSVHTKIEGGSFANADARGGSLDAFGVTRMYVQAGNLLLKGVTWQLGTLDSYFGDLGLYDMRPAQIFFETVGLSARYDRGPIDLLFGIGDSGYFIRRDQYSSILTAGGAARLRLGSHLEVGTGGQVLYEPEVRGNRFAPHFTPMPDNAEYVDFHRGEIVERFLEEHPGQEGLFPNPKATASLSYKVIAYLGFGNLGPVRWNNLFANYQLRHPENFRSEQFGGEEYVIYAQRLTDERHELTIGNEMQLIVVPGLVDALWGTLYGHQTNADNEVVAGEDNRQFMSTVLRVQTYITPTLHFLVEGSAAEEKSFNGNLWREHHDSIFASQDGASHERGNEYGDTHRRTTFQFKTGFILNPTGLGVYTRPSIRLMYGLQYSNVHNAFGNSFATTLAQFEDFTEVHDRNWHSVIGLEAEGWF